MVCCIDRKFCELLLKIGNALGALAGLALVAGGLYIEFGGADATDNLIGFLKLSSVEGTLRLATTFPIWIAVIGGVVFLLASISFCCTGSKLAKPFYCVYSTLLTLAAIAVIGVAVALKLAASGIESSDYQSVSVFGYDLTEKLQLLWVQQTVENTENVCSFEVVVGCSGFYNDQCGLPAQTSTNTQDILVHCPAQNEIFKTLGDLSPAFNNGTLFGVNDSSGWGVTECLDTELSNADTGCLASIAKLVYEAGTNLFIPLLVIGGYLALLSSFATYLTCCTLCGA